MNFRLHGVARFTADVVSVAIIEFSNDVIAMSVVYAAIVSSTVGVAWVTVSVAVVESWVAVSVAVVETWVAVSVAVVESWVTVSVAVVKFWAILDAKHWM